MEQSQVSETKFKSRWDVWTWLIVAITATLCLWPIFVDFELIPAIICVAVFLFVLILLISVYYRIEGGELKVYVLFKSHTFPIDKIAEIQSTNSALAAPACAFTRRIAIIFTDRSVLKSSAPLMISPSRLPEFLYQLKAINPNIIIKS